MNQALAALILGGMLGFIFGMMAGWNLALRNVQQAIKRETRKLLDEVSADDISKLVDAVKRKAPR